MLILPLKDYNPTRRLAIVTILLIAANVLVFAYQAYIAPQPLVLHVGRLAMIPYEITHGESIHYPLGEDRWGRTVYVVRDLPPWQTLLTSLFMHGSLWHLLGNMLFLWIFGNNIEDALGPLRFLLFYLACGVGASLVHVLFHLSSTTAVLGASGAVSGVMGAYLVLYPHARIRTLVWFFILITTVDLPAALYLVVWFIFQFIGNGPHSGVAWLAHVGGFVIGLVLIRLRPRRNRPVVEFLQ